ncbi:MAG TPA: fluoride efflux transporter CrcB, partial [Spirochaetia bacterium]|nr:fluoride efflux transporter CrcB [Spirochaetia bacterium]
SGLINNSVNDLFPWGTLVVNLAGSFLLGFIYQWAEEAVVDPMFKNFLTVGFLGALTTFSTYSLETVSLFRDGAIRGGVINLLASTGGGIACLVLGIVAARCVQRLLRG